MAMMFLLLRACQSTKGLNTVLMGLRTLHLRGCTNSKTVHGHIMLVWRRHAWRHTVGFPVLHNTSRTNRAVHHAKYDYNACLHLSAAPQCRDGILQHAPSSRNHTHLFATAPSKPTSRRAPAADNVVELQKEAARIAAVLAKYDDAYYTTSSPIVSDEAYDSMKRSLEELQQRLEAATGQQQPQRKVGAAPLSTLRKVRHALPMLSLAAVPDRSSLLKWFDKLVEQLPDVGSRSEGWVVEPKVDGLAVSLQYHQGRLVLAATRGDGREGEDVTHNIWAVEGVPHQLHVQDGDSGLRLPEVVEVRGEVYIKKKDFLQVNHELQQRGAKPLSNPRNAASGTLMLLDPAVAKSRRLSFLAYALLLPPGLSHSSQPSSATHTNSASSTSSNSSPVDAAQDDTGTTRTMSGKQTSASGRDAGGSGTSASPSSAAGYPMPRTQWEVLNWLRDAGFAVADDVQLLPDFHAAEHAAEEWMKGRDALGFEVDGSVLKVNSLALQQLLGTSRIGDPAWAVAWKFPAAEAVTTLQDIMLSVSRTGMVVPVAVLDPVNIGGVVVEKATLHNVGHVVELGLRLGDRVIVRRSGDVIPQVMGAVVELRNGQEKVWEAPSTCPSCAEPLVFMEGGSRSQGVILKCQNPSCSSRSLNSLIHFAHICIPGLGPATIKQLYDQELVSTPADLYLLKQAELMKLEKFGEVRSRKMLQQVKSSLALPMHKVLQGLDIRLLGEEKASVFEARLGSIRALSRVAPTGGKEEGLQVPGVGPELWGSIASWFSNPEKQELLTRLHEAGMACIEGSQRSSKQQHSPGAGEDTTPTTKTAVETTNSMPIEEKALQGMTILVTGTIPGLKRPEAQQCLATAGAKVSSSVSKSLSFLLVGEEPGRAKIRAAEKLGIQMRTVDEFNHQFPGVLSGN